MALPLLGAAAKFLMANGTRAAVKKYGPKAVETAKKEIKKRESAMTKKAEQVNLGKRNNPKQVARREETRTANQRNQRLDRERRMRGERSDLTNPPRMEQELRFKKGGTTSKKTTSMRGAGIAKKGFRPPKMVTMKGS